MALVQIATRIDSRLKQAVEEVCTQRGLKIGRFVQDALLDKLEELEDIEDLKAIRLEPTKSFSDVLSDVKPAAGRGSRQRVVARRGGQSRHGQRRQCDAAFHDRHRGVDGANRSAWHAWRR